MRKVIIVVIPLLLLFIAFIGIGIYLHSIPPIKYAPALDGTEYAEPPMPAKPLVIPSPLSFLWPYFLAIGIIGLLSTLIFVFRKTISKMIKDFIWFLID